MNSNWLDRVSQIKPVVFIERTAKNPNLEKDATFDKLLELLNEGYDMVEWVGSDRDKSNDRKDGKLEICEDLDNQRTTWRIVDFLAISDNPNIQADVIAVENEKGEPVQRMVFTKKYDGSQSYLQHDAPLYEHSHVGCSCRLACYKSTDPGDIIFVSRSGGTV